LSGQHKLAKYRVLAQRFSHDIQQV